MVVKDMAVQSAAEYRTEADGTVYTLKLFVLADGRWVFTTSFGEGRGAWWETHTPVHLSWDYVAEKLRLREGDRRGWETLLRLALGGRYIG